MKKERTKNQIPLLKKGIKQYAMMLIVAFLSLASAQVTQAQIYLNDFTGVSACPTNGNTPAMAANSTGAPVSRNTITCNATANVFNSTTVNATGSVNLASYIQFSATANAGFKLDLTTLSFLRQGSNSAPNQLEVRYSTDGFISSTAWGAAPNTPTSGSVITWDFADFSTPTAGTVTFRLYPFGTQRCDLTGPAASATGTFRLDVVTINGTVTAVATPTITPSVASLTGFNYVFGFGPSSSQNFTFTGTNLIGFPSVITVDAGLTAYEVSTDNINFLSSITYNFTGASLAAQTVYIRLQASQAFGSYNAQVINISGGGASNSISASGTVDPLTPQITVGVITPSNNFTTNAPTPSAISTFTVNGINLTNDLDISAVAGYEYSDNGGFSWSSALTYNTATVNKTISVRLLGTPVGSFNGSISITSTSATNSPSTIPVTGTVILVPTLTEVLVPQFIKGNSGSSRLPYVYRVTINNLTPNATYRFFNQVVISTDLATTNGAGNPIFMNGPTWVHATATGLSIAGTYDEFATDGAGSFTGWFGVNGTGNSRFTPGNNVFMRIMLNDGAGGNSVVNRVTTTSPIKCLDLVASAGANNGTALRSISNALAKDYIFVYDNELGTGRPLAGTFFESDGVAQANASTFYSASVDNVNKGWGLIIPNTNAAGVRNATSYSRASGNQLCVFTDADGVWPTGSINTVNPTGGTTAIVLANADVTMQCFLLPYANFTVSASTGTEAASTVITLNATLTGTIASAQTVDVVVSGLDITAGDYVLSSATLTFNAGTNPTASATFTVFNDILFEGIETATIDLVNPSAGIELGFTVSQNVIIIDNEVPKVVINEIMYNSVGSDEEWIELYNNDIVTITVDSTWNITCTPSSGAPWTRFFPNSTAISLAPGQFIIVRLGSAGAFPFTPSISLSTSPDQMANPGAPLVFKIGTAIIDNVTYSAVSFNPAANGGGPSLSLNNPSLDNSLAASWGACKINGTPNLVNFNCDAPIFYSILSGDMNPEIWNATTAIWSTSPIGTEGLCPTFTTGRSFVIQNTNTVRLNYIATAPSINNLTINAGGKLFTDVAVSGSEKYIRMFGNVINNGVLGNGVTYDAIGLSIEGLTSTLSGAGSYNLGRIRKDLVTNPISTVVVNANVNLRFPGAAFYNNVALSTLNLTLNAGRILTFTDATGDLSVDGVDGTGSGDRRGNITINGILDVSDKIFALTNNTSVATCSMTINATGRVTVGNVDANITGNGGALGAFPITINAGGKLNITKILKVIAGDLNSNGGIVLKSIATQTALIDGSGAGNVTGDVLVERKIGAISGYHFLSSPVQGAFVNNTVSGWRDDFTILSSVDGLQFIPGNTYSILPTVFEYDETNLNPNSSYGFIGATGVADAITPLKGFACVVPANTTIDVFGSVNNGPINYAVTKASDGINLIGNPYPSPINWSSFRAHNTNLETTYKAFITTGGYAGAYGEYNSFTSLGTNGVGNIIASSQAFTVTASTAGAIQAINTDRTTDLNPTYFSQPAITNDVLRLELVKDGAQDEIIIFFAPTVSSDNFDASTDAKKLFPFNTNQSFVYSIAGNDKLAMNGLGAFNSDKVIPLGIKAFVAGQHQIVATDLSSFAASAMVYLYDAETGTVQNLRNNPTYTANLTAGTHEGRFFIQFTPAVKLNTTDVTCFGNDGNLTLTYNSTAVLNVIVKNQSGTVITTLNNFNGQSFINNLAIGNYEVTYIHTNGYVSVDYFTVAGVTPVSLQANASLTQVAIGENVNFTALSSTGTTWWNFGDGVTAIGNDVNHIYNTNGNFVVVASTTNGECNQNIELSIDVNAATGIASVNFQSIQWLVANGQIVVKFAEALNENAIIEMFDLAGKQIYNGSISKGQTQHTIATAKFAEGIYVVKVLNNDNLTVKKVSVRK